MSNRRAIRVHCYTYDANNSHNPFALGSLGCQQQTALIDTVMNRNLTMYTPEPTDPSYCGSLDAEIEGKQAELLVHYRKALEDAHAYMPNAVRVAFAVYDAEEWQADHTIKALSVTGINYTI